MLQRDDDDDDDEDVNEDAVAAHDEPQGDPNYCFQGDDDDDNNKHIGIDCEDII